MKLDFDTGCRITWYARREIATEREALLAMTTFTVIASEAKQSPRSLHHANAWFAMTRILPLHPQ